ncbi:flagellar motor switch protein FliM [Pseudoneobacillus sp. C159]
MLSQQEIDALLSALNNGEIQAKDINESKDKVKVYDFKRAMRYSKEQLRSITRIHENFIRLITSVLSSQLRQYVQIEIDLVDQVTFHEFITSIPPRTIVNLFDVSPMEGKLALEINPQIAYAIVERMLGGQGDNTDRNGILTEIETALVRKVFSRAFEFYRDAWENIGEINAKWEAIETNPQFIQMASQNDTVIIIVMSTTIGDIKGRMTLCLPHYTLEAMLPKLSTQQWLYSMAKTDAPQQEKLKQNLDNVDVSMVAELGRGTLSVSDLLNLQVGDVIGIETGKVRVKVGQLIRFLGNPGLQKGRYAVQIDEVKDSEGDEL